VAEDERGGFDDLFEDLDRFFAPGESGEEARRRARESAEAAGRHEADAPTPEEPPQSAADDEASDRPDESAQPVEPEAPSPAAGSDEELLPAGWRPDIEGLQVPDDPGHDDQDDAAGTDDDEASDDVFPNLPQAGSIEDGPAGAAEAAEDLGEEEVEPGPVEITGPEDPDAAWRPEPTGEMTSEDWTRLRDVLGDDDEDDEADFLAGTSSPTDDQSLFGYDDADISGEVPPAAEERHDLTLEDLKKAPPEYADLPRAPDEEPFRPAASSPPAEESSSDEGSWEGPAIADVEAAADRLAAEFRDADSPGGVEDDLLSDLEEPRVPRTVKVGEVESLTGPAWEEPASRPLMTEAAPPPGPSAGRDLQAAILTGAVLAVLAVLSVAAGKVFFAIVAGLVVLIGQAELYNTMHRRGYHPARPLGLVLGALTMAGAYRKGEPAMAFFVVLGLLLAFLWYMAAPPKARENLLGNVGATLIGVLYGPYLAGYVLLLLVQPNRGRTLMLVVIGMTFAYDIVAFAAGSVWGRRPLAPTISPRKSWEGLLGASFVGVFLGIAVIKGFLHFFSLTQAIGLSVVIIVFAPLGDLVESLIKRDLGVKDMGALLPGHGGVLDRIDSVLLVAPAAFYFIRLVF
jgi:phosphatidate cytidylyltransferase